MVGKIIKIATSCENGFTYNLEEQKFVKNGFSVAYLETQDSHSLTEIKKCIDHALKNDKIVGGWSDNGKYYFDSVKIFENEEEAVKFAKENKQIAYYDLNLDKSIRL